MQTEASTDKKQERVWGTKTNTPLSRVRWAHVHEADTKGEFADNKFKLTLLVPKSVGVEALKNECLRIAALAFPGVPVNRIALPFRDGDEEAKSDEAPECGHWVFTTKTSRQPGILGPSTKVGEKFSALPEGKRIYSGCWVIASVTPFTYKSTEKQVDAATGKRTTVDMPGVALALENVLFRKDDTRLGGGSRNPADDFDGIDDLDLPFETDDGLI